MLWLIVLAQILALDIILSGDNAVVIAGAANTLPKALRNPALVAGVGLALLARIALVAVAGLLIHVKIISVLSGLMLFWVAYRMVKSAAAGGSKPDLHTGDMAAAISAIVIADVSMSLDNVVAIAGLSKGHPLAMVFGLALSVAILGLCAKIVAGAVERHAWLNWAGAALVAWIGLTLVV